jgi:hypothetical protein
MGRFEALVAEGLALGLDRAGAEARAREMLFSDGGEPGPSSQPSPSSDDSIEELWPKLRRKWDSRGTEGIELADHLEVLADMNALLNAGVISAGQHQQLLLRTQAQGYSPPEPMHICAGKVQRRFRAWRARERFLWVMREAARQAREEERKALTAKQTELMAKQAARGKRREARRRAAVRLQAAARRPCAATRRRGGGRRDRRGPWRSRRQTGAARRELCR